MAALALALLLLAPQQPELSAEQKQVNALIAQIRRLAASEPVIYGVDTRIKTAETVAGKYPKLARELLHEAEAELSGVDSQDERDNMRIRIIHAFAPLDLEEAERLAKSLRRDYIARAYDEMYVCFEQRPVQAREIVSKGFAAGAFRMMGASRLLEEQAKKSPESATAMFSEILGAFPVESPSSEDVLYLLQQTASIATVNRPLAIEAIDKALSAAASENLRIPSSDDKQQTPQATREKMFREIVALLGSIDPALLKRYQDARKELDLPVQSEKEEKPKEEKKEEKKEENDVDLGPLSYSEALARARKIKDSMFRTVALINISRSEELTAQQRASVASEALSAADKMALSDGRLIALAMISRDFARRGDLAKAGLAAQLLLETHNKVCACAAATCRYAGEKFDCMQNVEDFAEYLDEFKISADALSLDNISLQARMLVLKLHALLKSN